MKSSPLRPISTIRISLLAAFTATGLATAWGSGISKPPTSATGPASPSATTAPGSKVLQADDLLQKFPAGAGRAPKGSKVTIEGRIFDIRGSVPATAATATTARGTAPSAPAVHVVLVGTKEDPDDTAHITCALAPTLAARAGDLKVGQRIQISGTAGDVTAAMKRFDLTDCNNLTVVPSPPPAPADLLIGQWAGFMPPNMTGTFIFKADLTMSVSFIFNGGQPVKIPGKWRYSNSDDKTPVYTITLDKTDGPVDLTLNHDTLYVPSIPPLFTLGGTGKLEFQKNFGTPIPTDFNPAQMQTMQWVRANVSVPQPKTLIDNTTAFLQKASQTNDGYLITIGGGLTRSKKTTMIGAMDAKPFIFELNPAQAVATGVPMNNTSSKILRSNFGALAPEVAIQSVVLDKKNVYDPTQPLTGKITLRALKAIPGAKYSLLMQHPQGVVMQTFDTGIGLDTETIPFSIGAISQKGEPAPDNPMILFLCVARGQRVSETIPFLVDVTR